VAVPGAARPRSLGRHDTAGHLLLIWAGLRSGSHAGVPIIRAGRSWPGTGSALQIAFPSLRGATISLSAAGEGVNDGQAAPVLVVGVGVGVGATVSGGQRDRPRAGARAVLRVRVGRGPIGRSARSGLPRASWTGNLRLIHAATCLFRSSSMTS
jgi:hypothetical protein